MLAATALLAVLAAPARAGALVARPTSTISDSGLMVDAQALAKDPLNGPVTSQPVDLAATAGIKWARLFIDWVNVEFTAGTYDFSGIDPVVNDLQADGYKTLLTITGNYSGGQNLYASGNAPTNANGAMTPWLNFVAATVNHYPQAGAFEVWNEPNLSWTPSINAADYASLAIQTADKIHALRPGATVLLGGTSLIDKTFTQAVLAAGAGSHVDAFAFHPYRTYPEQPQDPFVAATGFKPNAAFVSLGAANYEEEVAQIKQWLAAAGVPNLPLWSDEAGYPSQLDTQVPGSIVQQAKNLLRYYTLNLGLGIKRASWFQLYDAVSLQNNIFTPAGGAFVDDYRSQSTSFQTFGLTYTLPTTSVQIGVGSYTSSSNVTVTAGTMTATNASNFAQYTVTPPAAGKYSLWARLKSVSTPDPAPTQAGLLDGNNWAFLFWTVNGSTYTVGTNGFGYDYFSFNAVSPLLQQRFTSAALLDYYWSPIGANAGNHPQVWYPIQFDLPAGASTFRVMLANAAISELRLVPQGALTPKLAGLGLLNLASIFDDRVGPAQDFSAAFSSSTLAEFRSASFVTDGGIPIVAYWMGVPAVDSFVDRSVAVHLSAPVNDPVLVDPIAGTYASAGSGGQDFTLRVQDYPLILTSLTALQKTSSDLILVDETYNYPNPARGSQTTLRFFLSRASDVTLDIYNPAHKLIHSAKLSGAAGRNAYTWDLGGAANGVYLWRLSAGGQSVVKKILILR
jgi:hypothetical protein